MFRLVFCCTLLWLQACLWAGETLDSIAKVRQLSIDEAQRGLPVRVEGTVTFFNPQMSALFVDEGNAGIYVYSADGPLPADSPLHSVKVGSKVRVEGTTNPGRFMPMIVQSRIEILGEGPLPEALHPREDELLNPNLDGQWVEVSGLVIGVENGGDLFTLVVEIHGWTVKMLVLDGYAFADRAAALIHRHVKVRAVAVNTFNGQREMTGRYFCVPSFAEIVDSDPGESNAEAPLTGTDGLLRYGSSTRTRLRVRGTVTHASGNEVYIRDEAGGLEVRMASVMQLVPGDRIEAEGFAGLAPFRPILRATRVSVTGHEAPPIPQPLIVGNRWRLDLHAALVTIDADVLGSTDGLNGMVLHCHAGDHFFEALLPKGAALPADLVANCRVRLAGICELATTHPLPRTEWVDTVYLHLRGTGDVVILQRPPWWTLRRILWALGGVAVLALMALIWVVVLRRTVAEQTQTIGRQIEHAAIKDERERIARELHDTIEQELAGVSMQLGNVREHLAGTPEAAAAALDLARRMLRHCSEEARTSIRDLRSISLEQSGLHGALGELLEPVAAECAARFDFQIQGEPFPLGSVAELHLLRIAQESVSNAVRHGAPRAIEVRLTYDAGSVTLQIRDDGKGFDPHAPAPRGHFGLSGLRERANKLRARLTLESSPGAGTTVRLVVPLESLCETA